MLLFGDEQQPTIVNPSFMSSIVPSPVDDDVEEVENNSDIEK